jgi:hypothetical protein
VDEYVLATPVSNVAGTLISELGLQSVPSVVTVTLNPLYTAEDEHSI